MKNQQLEEGQIVLCKVEKILGTTVFCKIEGDGEGTLTTSEISPGRIRNLRQYVFPGKKIVCKILSLKNGVHLSLRRVKQNEKKELLDKIKKEKNYSAILKTILGKEEAKKRIEEIKKETNLIDFIEQIKTNRGLLEKYFKKQDAEKIIKILESKKEKLKEIKQIFKLSSKSENGIKIIKKIIQDANKNANAKIIYLAAGKYVLSLTGKEFKEIKIKINQVIQEIEKQAKKQNCEFSLEKKLK